MARIRISQQIDAPVAETWHHLADLASHSTWMKDAESIEFISERRSGVGTKIRVPTKVGPLRTTDIIEVVSWSPEQQIGVEHRGLVSGVGEFRLEAEHGSSSLVVWEEALSFPWWWGGPVGAWLARPILRWIWKGNLRRLAQVVTG